MATLFSDSFDRTNAANLGANWDADTTSFCDWDIDTNFAEAQGSQAAGNWIRTTSAAHAATADVKVSATQDSASGDGGILARCTKTDSDGGAFVNTGYALFASGAAPGLNLIRAVDDVEVQIGSGASITHAASKVMALEVSGAGATVTIKTYYDGVLKETLSDTDASRITAAGRTGLTNWATAANGRYNDFLVEDLGAAAGVVARDTVVRQAAMRAATY